MGVRTVDGVPSMAFRIESAKPPSHLDARIRAFLTDSKVKSINLL